MIPSHWEFKLGENERKQKDIRKLSSLFCTYLVAIETHIHMDY